MGVDRPVFVQDGFEPRASHRLNRREVPRQTFQVIGTRGSGSYEQYVPVEMV
jgi:hypothetical protein